MIYLCGCGKFHENYPCTLCDDCLNTADGFIWDKLTPKSNFIPEHDTANLTDEEAEQWCFDCALSNHETNEHLEQT